MGRNVLAHIDMRDEYIRQLLLPFEEELGLTMPVREPLAIEQYDVRDRRHIGMGHSEPRWTREEDSDEG